MLIRFLLGQAFGESDTVRRDEEPWPTWLVNVLLILFLGGVGTLVYFMYTAK